MQYFDKKDLRTTDGEPVGIFHTGSANHDAGPDFANARVKIGDIDWVGSVEIHIHSSGWLDHHHDLDPAYDNVVLHVVWKHDREIKRRDAGLLPTIELRERVDASLVHKYRQLVTSSFSIPCQRSLPDVPALITISMLERAMLQRLERRAVEVHALLDQNGKSWEETFYQMLARSFGFKVNAEPFFQLARSLPLKIILKQCGSPEQIDALLLGQAGFLEAPKGDEYYLKLRREYALLAQKYSLHLGKMSKSQWRFMRLRPANFPSLRLAQLGALLLGGRVLFSNVLESEHVDSLYGLLAARPSPYWENHYQFSRKTKTSIHELGKSSMDVIIANTIVPFWVAYGKRMDDQQFVDKAVRVLQQLPAEENRITRLWKDVGINSRSAFDSQALLELFNNFCRMKSCLDCNIGTSLVRPV